jgi:hypothetical protein
MDAARMAGETGMSRGNSFANGSSHANGPHSPRRWGNGWQAPEPVTLYTLTEGDRYT